MEALDALGLGASHPRGLAFIRVFLPLMDMGVEEESTTPLHLPKSNGRAKDFGERNRLYCAQMGVLRPIPGRSGSDLCGQMHARWADLTRGKAGGAATGQCERLRQTG